MAGFFGDVEYNRDTPNHEELAHLLYDSSQEITKPYKEPYGEDSITATIHNCYRGSV